MKTPVSAYRHGRQIYINLTNRCPNSCVFCVGKRSGMCYEGNNLDLSSRGEPPAKDVIAELKALLANAPADEAVFCGYGEPTMRLPELIETAHWLKTQKIRTRINTIGLGSLVWGRDITPELCAAVDEISVSLNCADKESWLKTVRPLPQYAEKGFDAVLEFIKNCLPRAKKVTVTTVDLGSAADARVKDLAGKLGVNFRLREFIKDASVHG